MSFGHDLSEAAAGAVLDATRCLLEMQSAPVGDSNAPHRLAALRASHPEFLFELICEKESFDNSLHYCIIIYDTDSNTVSLSYSGQSLPWPLRGTRKWSDAELVQVNGRTLAFQDAVLYMDTLWRDTDVANRLVNVALLREEIARASVTASDDELQEGLDGLRRYYGLYDEDLTRQWMHERGLSHEQFEQIALDNVVYRKLRQRIAERDADEYFARCRGDLDYVQVWTTSHRDEGLARTLYESLLRLPPEQRLEIAIANVRDAGISARIELRTIRRRDLAMFPGTTSLSEGTVLGPLRIKDLWLLNGVMEVRAAEMDSDTRGLVEEILFERWLTERRRTASITWFWGTSDRSSPSE